MSHIVRCGALEASMKDRMEWLDDTMDYMAGRYPQLNDLKLAKLEIMGRQYLKPAIPHGKDYTAITMDRTKASTAGEDRAEAEVDTGIQVETAAEVQVETAAEVRAA
jgi:hypothetical protein